MYSILRRASSSCISSFRHSFLKVLSSQFEIVNLLWTFKNPSSYLTNTVIYSKITTSERSNNYFVHIFMSNAFLSILYTRSHAGLQKLKSPLCY